MQDANYLLSLSLSLSSFSILLSFSGSPLRSSGNGTLGPRTIASFAGRDATHAISGSPPQNELKGEREWKNVFWTPANAQGFLVTHDFICLVSYRALNI
jgi:hypothetical protein